MQKIFIGKPRQPTELILVKLPEERGLIASLRQEQDAKDSLPDDSEPFANKHLRKRSPNDQISNLRLTNTDYCLFEIWI